ncbi:DUF4402 domain-containing protein [Sphingomonas swuensis]
MCRTTFLGLPLLLLAAAADAQTVKSAVPRANAQSVLVYPLTVVTKNNMDFGYISVLGAGQAIIDPNTSALSVSGGITPMGGSPRPATFAGAARSAAVVNLRVPNQPITLTRVGGTETMQVRNFTLQGNDKRTLARLESFEFNVGATLVVNAGQAEGIYTGTFDVLVQYP